MGPDLVLLSQPNVYGGLCLTGRVKPCGVQDLLAHGAVEAFIISVLPRPARIDPDERAVIVIEAFTLFMAL